MGSLNLCLEKPDSTKKESGQFDHPAQRKRPKCVEILGYFDIYLEIVTNTKMINLLTVKLKVYEIEQNKGWVNIEKNLEKFIYNTTYLI